MSLAPVQAAGRAWALLWEQRALHARAIWPPVVFLVAAEFLYHRVVGNAEGAAGHLAALLDAPWYMLAGAALAWLAGLKFLLSFSISWRRHLLHGDRFDPFFFARPFWRYLGFLLLTYLWILLVVLAGLLVSVALVAALPRGPLRVAGFLPMAVAIGVVVFGVVRQVPFFTALTADRPHPPWRASVRAMRGNVLRYLAAFVLAMLPVVLLNLALDEGLKLAHADRHAVAVALGESAFRQAMLFVHFALGAALGALTTRTLFPATGAPP